MCTTRRPERRFGAVLIDARVATIEAEMRELRREIVALRELLMSRLQLPPNTDFEVEAFAEEPTNPDARLVDEIWGEYEAAQRSKKAKEKAPTPEESRPVWQNSWILRAIVP